MMRGARAERGLGCLPAHEPAAAWYSANAWCVTCTQFLPRGLRHGAEHPGPLPAELPRTLGRRTRVTGRVPAVVS